VQNEAHQDRTSTTTSDAAADFQSDLIAIQQIPAVPTILDVICRTTGMGFAAVARVTENRWIACSVKDEIGFGLQPGGELDIETTICHEIRQSREGVVIDNVKEDDVYCRHHTPAKYGLQSYISLPIILPDGRFFGTLCAIDPRPAKVNTPEVIGMFKLFAELIAFHLDANQMIASSTAALLREQEISRLREEFIAVLGHDLRNPLAGVAGATRLLRKTPLNEHATSLLDMMHSSVLRMSGLVDNVLDFARGRLGGGITLNKVIDQRLLPVLEQVILELQVSAPDRIIEAEFAVDKPVHCDAGRIGQLFSNLLGNAISHGTAAAPIRVRATTSERAFELSVANAGEPIAPAAMERLFQPFARGEVRPSLQGLGLGLYIASEVARAHDGTLSVASSPEETCFTFRMPRT
jgi:signal transduction histidine kinase